MQADQHGDLCAVGQGLFGQHELHRGRVKGRLLHKELVAHRLEDLASQKRIKLKNQASMWLTISVREFTTNAEKVTWGRNALY